MESPPNSVVLENTKVVTVPVVPVISNDETYYYAFVKASLYSSDSAVFGLLPEEIQAIAKKFLSDPKPIENGVMIKVCLNIKFRIVLIKILLPLPAATGALGNQFLGAIRL